MTIGMETGAGAFDWENLQRTWERWTDAPHGLAYWERTLLTIDKVQAAYAALSESQLNRLAELRERINLMTPREAAYVSGLFVQCLGVAAAEGGTQ